MSEKLFRFYYTQTIPGYADVLAKDVKEAEEKFGDWEVEEFDEDSLQGDIRTEHIEEMKQ